MPQNHNSIEEFIAERNEALISLDLDYIKKVCLESGRPESLISTDFLLSVLHMSRYEVVDLDDDIRHWSGAWLRKRGFPRMTGEPLLAFGELPI